MSPVYDCIARLSFWISNYNIKQYSSETYCMPSSSTVKILSMKINYELCIIAVHISLVNCLYLLSIGACLWQQHIHENYRFILPMLLKQLYGDYDIINSMRTLEVQSYFSNIDIMFTILTLIRRNANLNKV